MTAGRYDLLFEPVKIGPKVAPNRFVSVPHALGHSPLMPNGSIAIRTTRADGGWGTVAMQLAEIDPTSDISDHPMERLYDATDVRAHRKLTDALRKRGALSAIELGHTGLRSRGIGTGYPVMGPSGGPILMKHMPMQAKTMTKADIRAFRDSHRAAVRRSREAGYDIVYVYAAHDASLLWHFLSPAYNRRTDEYGGSFENRLRLLREVLEDTREEAGDDMAVAIRFAVHELAGPQAITNDGEGRAAVEELAELPDLWDVNVSSWPRDSGTSRFDDEGFQEEFVSFVKKVTSKPVLGVGRFTSPDTMVSMVRRGVLDLIGAARPSIADPYLPNKIREGRVEDIRECIGCNICVSCDGMGVPLRCTQNPTISEEWRRGWHPETVPVVKRSQRVLVVGSGPAGLEASLVLARAGHHVTLAERAAEFGGRVTREARLPGLAAWGRVRDYRLYQLQQMGNVDLFAESELDAAAIAEMDADHVLLATGSRWIASGEGRTRRSSVPGFEGSAVAPDVVMDGAELPGPVIVYDDEHYYMGNVLALSLSRRGHEVHLVSPMPEIATFMGLTLEQPRVVGQLLDVGVKMYPNTVAERWTNNVLTMKRADTGQQLPALHGETLISVGVREPNSELGQGLDMLGVAHRFIGDAEAPGTLQAAIYSGHRHAREILEGSDKVMAFRRETPVLFD